MGDYFAAAIYLVCLAGMLFCMPAFSAPFFKVWAFIFFNFLCGLAAVLFIIVFNP